MGQSVTALIEIVVLHEIMDRKDFLRM